MFKRLMIRSIAVFIAVTTACMPLTAHAQSNNTSTTSNNNQVTDLIQAGLWQGINFNFNPARIPGVTVTPGNGTTTPQTPATAGAYVALGDSVAAGVGLSGAVTASSAERRCDRTSQAYPYQVASALNLPLVHLACSGATTRDFYTHDWTPSPSLPAQLNTAFAGGTPGLITITSGANDIRWLGFLDTCYRRSCATTSSSTALTSSLKLLEGRYDRTFRQIQTLSGNNPPTVIITGYYDPVSSACNGVIPSVTPEEIAWISDSVDRLNQTIQDAAAKYSFVYYAPVDFTGHDICSSDPWVQDLNSPRPFHPTAEGQQVMAQSVLSVFNK